MSVKQRGGVAPLATHRPIFFWVVHLLIPNNLAATEFVLEKLFDCRSELLPRMRCGQIDAKTGPLCTRHQSGTELCLQQPPHFHWRAWTVTDRDNKIGPLTVRARLMQMKLIHDMSLRSSPLNASLAIKG